MSHQYNHMVSIEYISYDDSSHDCEVFLCAGLYVYVFWLCVHFSLTFDMLWTFLLQYINFQFIHNIKIHTDTFPFDQYLVSTTIHFYQVTLIWFLHGWHSFSLLSIFNYRISFSNCNEQASIQNDDNCKKMCSEEFVYRIKWQWTWIRLNLSRMS